MVKFRDPDTVLPEPSWNLWENAKGIHTFTCATVVAGLRAAANFARLFSEGDRADIYEKAASEIVAAMAERLYDPDNERFLRGLGSNGSDEIIHDAKIDASLFAVFYFGCFRPDDPMVVSTMNAMQERLASGGGIARFEDDDYMRTDPASVGNPWFITTLWLAEYYIAAARAASDLDKAVEILEWTANAALPSGVLAEQLDPATGAPVSVSPLTWSHSTFIGVVHSYLRRRTELNR